MKCSSTIGMQQSGPRPALTMHGQPIAKPGAASFGSTFTATQCMAAWAEPCFAARRKFPTAAHGAYHLNGWIGLGAAATSFE
jgi:hypothetical protein